MPPGDDIHTALTRIFRTVFNRDNLVLTRTLSARDVAGWDSFRQVDIILAIEELFDIELSSKEMDSLKNVGDILDLLAEKTVSS